MDTMTVAVEGYTWCSEELKAAGYQGQGVKAE